jgi:hypothetical protein
MAFGADELHVLRRALAVALHPTPLLREDVQACLRLAESVDEAVHEAGRLRAFLLADLARYRQALPGSVVGYLELLREALAAGCPPRPEDLTVLRALRGNPVAAALLDRCLRLSGQSVRGCLAGSAADHRPVPTARPPRTRLLSLPGGRAAEEKPHREPRRPSEPPRPSQPRPPSEPRQPQGPGRPAPGKPMPKPSEVFPPRRRPAPPPERLAVG